MISYWERGGRPIIPVFFAFCDPVDRAENSLKEFFALRELYDRGTKYGALTARRSTKGEMKPLTDYS